VGLLKQPRCWAARIGPSANQRSKASANQQSSENNEGGPVERIRPLEIEKVRNTKVETALETLAFSQLLHRLSPSLSASRRCSLSVVDPFSPSPISIIIANLPSSSPSHCVASLFDELCSKITLQCHHNVELEMAGPAAMKEKHLVPVLRPLLL